MHSPLHAELDYIKFSREDCRVSWRDIQKSLMKAGLFYSLSSLRSFYSRNKNKVS